MLYVRLVPYPANLVARIFVGLVLIVIGVVIVQSLIQLVEHIFRISVPLRNGAHMVSAIPVGMWWISGQARRQA